MSAMSAKPAYFNPLPRKEGDTTDDLLRMLFGVFQSTPS